MLCSPLRWAALLRDRPAAALAAFAAPPAALPPAERAGLPGGQPSVQALPVGQPLWAAEADRRAEVLALATELLGAAIEADQSFMEVSW